MPYAKYTIPPLGMSSKCLQLYLFFAILLMKAMFTMQVKRTVIAMKEVNHGIQGRKRIMEEDREERQEDFSGSEGRLSRTQSHKTR